jgi:hypothetical protein
MNERIKELMVQVCKEQGLPFTVEHNRAYMLDNFSEKFAELIVAECLEACSRANEIKHFVPPTQEQVVLSCMREIETTFRS